jgi:hypothetical protein
MSYHDLEIHTSWCFEFVLWILVLEVKFDSCVPYLKREHSPRNANWVTWFIRQFVYIRKIYDPSFSLIFYIIVI